MPVDFEAVAKDGVDAKTLVETSAHMRYAFAADLGTSKGVASTAAWYLSLSGDLGSVNALWKAVGEVTSTDLKAIAAKYFVKTNRTVITLKTEGSP